MSRGRHLVTLAVCGALLGPALVAASYAGGGAGTMAGALSGQPFTLNVAKVAAKKGQPAKATVTIMPAAGYHMNAEYPTSLKLKPPEGVTVANADLKKADAKLSDRQASFEVVVTAASAGKKVVPGELRFAVCTDTTCDPQRSPVSIEVDVQ